MTIASTTHQAATTLLQQKSLPMKRRCVLKSGEMEREGVVGSGREEGNWREVDETVMSRFSHVYSIGITYESPTNHLELSAV